MHDVIKVNGKSPEKNRCPLCLRKENVVQTLCRVTRFDGRLLAKGLVACRKSEATIQNILEIIQIKVIL